MRIRLFFKSVVLCTLTLALCISTQSAMAQKSEKKKKAKKESVSDPRLLTVQSMTKATKESQFVKKGVYMRTKYRAGCGVAVSPDEATIYYSQPGDINKLKPGFTRVHENYIVRTNSGKKDFMTLRYFGNSNSIAVEHAADGDYIWVSSNGSKFNGAYGHTRTISRIKYEAGAELNNGYAGETYYMGGARYCWPALDVENDILGVATQAKGEVTINIYTLSEARTLPDTEVKIKTTWKGENMNETEETVVRTIKCKDLTTLEPIATFVIPKPAKESVDYTKDINSFTFRAWDLDKDYVYFVEGNHNAGNMKANGPSRAFITVFDYAGRVAMERRRIQAVHDQYLLESLFITPYGYADVGGFCVNGSKMYVMFSVNNNTTREGFKNGFRAVTVRY